jgi:DNA-binding transcriptional LysR family regulator
VIDLAHLRLFVRVAELGSFTKAALATGIAQPTVSRVMKELERQWDGELFYRTGRGVTLSELGEAAFARARALLTLADQTSEELRAHARLPSGIVSLALPPSLVASVVPRLVNALRSETPGIRLRIYEGFSDQIERWLSSGDVEVGLYSRYREKGEVTGPALFTSQLVLAAHRDMPALPSHVPFHELRHLPLVLPALPNGLRAIAEDIARRLRISLNVMVDADSILAQKQISEHCGCYMIKAPHIMAEESALGMFRTAIIVDPVIERYVVIATTQQRPLSRAAREVADRVTALLRARAQSERGAAREGQAQADRHAEAPKDILRNAEMPT